MKRIRIALSIALFALVGLIGATAPVSAVTDNGTGVFWVYQGSSGTGAWRDFNVGPDQLYNFVQYNYVGNCGGTCTTLNNTISSVRLSCGTSGTTFSSLDWIKFYTLDSGAGTSQTINTTLASCSGGVRTINLNATLNNAASSMVTHNGG